MRHTLAALLALGITALCPARTSAQGCCTPGTSPLGGIHGSALAPGRIEAGFEAEHDGLQQAYQGSESVADPAGRRSTVARLLPWVRVGLPASGALFVELPLEYRMREQPQAPGKPGEMFRLSNTAPGDLSTSLMVHVPRSRPRPWGIAVGLGVKWATASVEREQDGLRLPVELQTGTGSNDPLVLVAGHRTWATAGATVAAITRFPREGRNGYRYGTETNAALAADWSPRPAWGFGGEFRVRTAAGDRYLGLARPNTGGSRLMFAPRARATPYGTGLAMEAALLWPLAQHLNGLQIGVDRTARLGVRGTPR